MRDDYNDLCHAFRNLTAVLAGQCLDVDKRIASAIADLEAGREIIGKARHRIRGIEQGLNHILSVIGGNHDTNDSECGVDLVHLDPCGLRGDPETRSGTGDGDRIQKLEDVRDLVSSIDPSNREAEGLGPFVGITGRDRRDP